MEDKTKKNPLSIILTESAVFLRLDRAGRRLGSVSRPSILRGLLILDLAKPTKITSIELELQAKSTTAWPEGVGARRTEVVEEHRIFQASTTYFQAKKPQNFRTSSIGPGITCLDDNQGVSNCEPQNSRDHDGVGPNDQLPLQDADFVYLRRRDRHLSADNSTFQRIPISHEVSIALTPPYSPSTTHPSSPSFDRPSIYNDISINHEAQSLEEFRNSLNAGLRNHQSHSKGVPPIVPTSPSLRSFHPELSLSRRPSVEDLPENEAGPSTLWHLHHTPSNGPSREVSRPPTPALARPNENRGRRSARFNLSSVSSALMDVVRSTSPKARDISDHSGSEEKIYSRRGRTNRKGKYTESPSSSLVRMRQSKERPSFSKFGDILKLERDQTEADGWKEFKKGIYTYPISFSIPETSPATLKCTYGSVNWRLRAIVHRPGAFKSKYAASREVIVITCPPEEDIEDTEGISVERHWDQQLQYLISVSGRSFYIGGTIPISFTLMPLGKIKIHRISVFIEERIDYYTHMKRIARTDPVTRFQLLNLKETGQTPQPILPLDSDDVDAFKNSPLYSLVAAGDDVSEMASNLMGPGPWTFHQNLKLPTSCSLIRITNKNRKSNTVITHSFKCIIRVERGDDLYMDKKTGKRKLFDIVVQTPITILSCQCNPMWASLPRYSESFKGTSTLISKCPCKTERLADGCKVPSSPATIVRVGSNQSLNSDVSNAETSSIDLTTTLSLRRDESLINQSRQYERLISGQESELGEAPPTYTASVRTPL